MIYKAKVGSKLSQKQLNNLIENLHQIKKEASLIIK